MFIFEFLFNQGRESFNRFMTTVLAQIVFGGIALLVLYRATLLPIEFESFVFYAFLILLWLLFGLWVISSCKDFIESFQLYLKNELPALSKEACKLMVRDVWREDRKKAIEYSFIIILIIGILIFLFFGTGISAVQIAESIKME